MLTTFDPRNRCPWCGGVLCGQWRVGGPDEAPRAGDVAVCTRCVQVSVVEGGGRRRRATNEELVALMLDEEVAPLLVAAVRSVVAGRERLWREIAASAREN